MNKKESITEKVKTYEDACKVLGLDPENLPIVEHLPEKDRKSIVAFYRLTIITRALNEGWEPDWANWGQERYVNRFYVEPDFSSDFNIESSPLVVHTSYSIISSRLCFKTRELAEYAAENFMDIYFEYLFIDMPKNYRK